MFWCYFKYAENILSIHLLSVTEWFFFFFLDIDTKLTNIGQSMATLPVSPRYAKMLVLAHQHDLMPYAVAMVAALSIQELFLPIKKTQDTVSLWLLHLISSAQGLF